MDWAAGRCENSKPVSRVMLNNREALFAWKKFMLWLLMMKQDLDKCRVIETRRGVKGIIGCVRGLEVGGGSGGRRDFGWQGVDGERFCCGGVGWGLAEEL